MRRDFAGNQITRHDAFSVAVDHDQIEDLGPRVHFHTAAPYLAAESLIRAEEELLACLTARVKRARNLRAAERASSQQPAVLAGKGNPLRDALVDNANAGLCQAVDVGFARPEVTALDGVVKQPLDAVAVIGVILGRINPTLGGNAVCPARAVLKTETFNIVPKFTQRGGGRGARQAAANDDDIELPPVGGIHQLEIELMAIPFLSQRTGRDFGIE